ncbi:MAG: PIG-L family deacetylase [Cellvibrionaceae bacterium]|nr:PIG-L family deacetylase [Cellvibrionaceae bacterium]
MSAAKKILAVVAHCDDEALGCGGTLARHAEEGDEVHVVFLADGVGSRGGFNAVEHDRREQAAGRALAALGVKHWQSLGLRDNALDSYPLLEIIQPLEAFLRTFPAEVIYTHHGGDLNIDHQLTHRAVLTACRPIPGQSVRNIFCFEVLSSTEWGGSAAVPFRPNHFVDISKQWPRKLAALEAYSLEMRNFPHARSLSAVEALAALRGSNVGITHAEAFMLERSVW